jgi:hypothetical protein
MKSGCAFGADITAESGELLLETVMPGDLGEVTLSGILQTPIGEVQVEGGLKRSSEEPISLAGT